MNQTITTPTSQSGQHGATRRSQVRNGLNSLGSAIAGQPFKQISELSNVHCRVHNLWAGAIQGGYTQPFFCFSYTFNLRVELGNHVGYACVVFPFNSILANNNPKAKEAETLFFWKANVVPASKFNPPLDGPNQEDI